MAAHIVHAREVRETDVGEQPGAKWSRDSDSYLQLLASPLVSRSPSPWSMENPKEMDPLWRRESPPQAHVGQVVRTVETGGRLWHQQSVNWTWPAPMEAEDAAEARVLGWRKRSAGGRRARSHAIRSYAPEQKVRGRRRRSRRRRTRGRRDISDTRKNIDIFQQGAILINGNNIVNNSHLDGSNLITFNDTTIIKNNVYTNLENKCSKLEVHRHKFSIAT